jgi:hypothetical protein
LVDLALIQSHHLGGHRRHGLLLLLLVVDLGHHLYRLGYLRVENIHKALQAHLLPDPGCQRPYLRRVHHRLVFVPPGKELVDDLGGVDSSGRSSKSVERRQGRLDLLSADPHKRVTLATDTGSDFGAGMFVPKPDLLLGQLLKIVF